MTNLSDIDEILREMERVVKYAEEQLTEGKRQEPTNEVEYSQSQSMLEEVNMQLEKIIQSTQPEHRDRLIRMQQRVNQLQNRMILRL